MQNKIIALSSMFSEDEIVKKLEISHIIYRGAVFGLDDIVPATRGVAEEIYHEYNTSNATIKELATKFKCPYEDAHRAVNGKYMDRAKIDSMQKDGYTRRAIAEALGVSIGSIPVNKHKTDMRALIVDLHKQGYSAADIAAELDVSLAYVYQNNPNRAKRELAEGRFTYRNTKDADWPAIIDYAKQHSPTEAAKKFNVARTSVYYYMNKK